MLISSIHVHLLSSTTILANRPGDTETLIFYHKNNELSDKGFICRNNKFVYGFYFCLTFTSCRVAISPWRFHITLHYVSKKADVTNHISYRATPTHSARYANNDGPASKRTHVTTNTIMLHLRAGRRTRHVSVLSPKNCIKRGKHNRPTFKNCVCYIVSYSVHTCLQLCWNGVSYWSPPVGRNGWKRALMGPNRWSWPPARRNGD